MITKYKRWRRLAPYRPKVALTPVSLAYGIILCLVALCAVLALYAINAHYDAKASINKTSILQKEFDDVMHAHLVCLNGGMVYVTLESLPSGGFIKVGTKCEKAKEVVL